MKKIFLLYLISSTLFLSCKKDAPSTENNIEAMPEAKKKLHYIQELETQKNLLNEKNKYWTARTLITDSEEKLLDVDTSLDGKWVLYVTKGKEASYIYALDTQSGAMPRMIFKDTRNIFWAKFNETSEKVLFSVIDRTDKHYLNTIDLNKPIFQLPERADPAIDGCIDSSAFSAQHILALTQGGEPIMDAQGFSTLKGDLSIELKQNNIVFKTFNKAHSPSWSKNGNSLLFISEAFGQPEIVKWDTSERGIQRITTSKGGNRNPRFSPDNEWIIYSSNESGKNNIYITNLSNQTNKRISYMKDMEFFKPVWGNDGKIYAIGIKQKLSYLFQFKMEGRMFQVQVNGEPGPGLTKLQSPTENAENNIEKE
jgi:Tol biopolymer transport system component